MQKSADVIRHVLTNASKVKKEASVL